MMQGQGMSLIALSSGGLQRGTKCNIHTQYFWRRTLGRNVRVSLPLKRSSGSSGRYLSVTPGYGKLLPPSGSACCSQTASTRPGDQFQDLQVQPILQPGAPSGALRFSPRLSEQLNEHNGHNGHNGHCFTNLALQRL